MKLRTFKSKNEVFRYLVKNFSKNAKLILIRGSTASKPVKQFSDFDVEVYGKKKKPYYEIAFVKNNPVLITIYFYKYNEGKKANAPKNVKVIYGRYNNKIKPDFSPDNYTAKQKITRECQLNIDFMFKYLRSRNKKYLESVQKGLK